MKNRERVLRCSLAFGTSYLNKMLRFGVLKQRKFETDQKKCYKNNISILFLVSGS